LLSRIGGLESLPGREEFDLVIGILERADTASDLLRNAALEAILDAVEHGTGATRYAGGLGAGKISPEEVELIGRILDTIPGGAGAMSYRQAQLLYAIRDAANLGGQPKQWAFLFIESIARYLQAFEAEESLSAEKEKEFEAFMFNEGAAMASFFGRLHDGDFRDALRHDESLEPLERGVLEYLYEDYQRSLREQAAVKPRRHAA
jgi:hypothetical protein